jgi:NifB/MoaA-like Fe-S oxidoreductase
MRGTNGPMDVITRAELTDYMKDIPTKSYLEQSLADSKSQVASTVREVMKETVEDLKVDLLDALEKKVTDSHRRIAMNTVTLRELTDAKNDILATTRRNLSEAMTDLGNRMDVQHGITHGKLDDLSKHVHMVLGEHENRMKDQEASS